MVQLHETKLGAMYRSTVLAGVYTLEKSSNAFTAIIVAVEVHDISWRSVVEKVRMHNSRTLIYTIANCCYCVHIFAFFAHVQIRL